ncbi:MULTISPECIES: Holliday junction resolvase RuvX [Aneurinibacillus]|jgi:putative Holliday junction resolvase|uniref:Putative pre-16S rRNA nuclease n=1 Tax=Aneurinibacillus danicus TaxID=267746 RepID=A0A511VC19_9BACL|nr:MULTISPECIES: Holliday junction resolvase RuvX [Aneurinibacillus]GEN35478.1 putative pre-16S rRNA nuclease [Aneurinibacillus danicus]
MRKMGLDVGEKTIGVAISDEFGWTAQGIETIRREGKKKDYLRIEELIKQYDVGEIIVGLPKNMNGTIGPRGEMCQAFAEYVQNRSRLPVKMWDERLTTMAAEKMLVSADVSRKKRKQVIDKMAAVIILQNYLDAQK